MKPGYKAIMIVCLMLI